MASIHPLRDHQPPQATTDGMYRSPGFGREHVHTELSRLGTLADRAREFPRESFDLLLLSGAQAFMARESTPSRALMDWLRWVGSADLSLGRLFEGHVNAIQLIRWYGNDSQSQTLQHNLAAGKIYGVWASEPPPGTAMSSDGGLLSGSKHFASGAGYIDYALVTCKGDAQHRIMVLVPANEASRADCAAWQVRGMRATMSGRYDLAGIAIGPEAIIGRPGDYDLEPRFTAGAWRFLAVQLGGIEALVIEMRAAMSDAAKADPLQRQKFANAVEASRTARFWVTECARIFERDYADGPAFVRMARGVVESAATDVMANVARVIGTRSAFDGQRIDKISRDLSLYLRQAGPDDARDQAAVAWLNHDIAEEDDCLW